MSATHLCTAVTQKDLPFCTKYQTTTLPGKEMPDRLVLSFSSKFFFSNASSFTEVPRPGGLVVKSAPLEVLFQKTWL